MPSLLGHCNGRNAQRYTSADTERHLKRFWKRRGRLAEAGAVSHMTGHWGEVQRCRFLTLRGMWNALPKPASPDARAIADANTVCSGHASTTTTSAKTARAIDLRPRRTDIPGHNTFDYDPLVVPSEVMSRILR